MKNKKIFVALFFIALSFSKVYAQNIEITDNSLWVDAKELNIEGMLQDGETDTYTRIPNKYKNVVRSKIWNLSRQSAGIVVKFKVTGTTAIKAKWTLRTERAKRSMRHMTDVGISGLDLYVRKKDGKWSWMGYGRPNNEDKEQNSELRKGLNPRETYELMLYLPLYNGVSDLKIGVDNGALIRPVEATKKKPLVFYGSSIMQGCSASRPGMAFSSMLGREFDVSVFNFGFSGNGFTEECFADIMGEIDATAYFIDCLPNMGSFSEQEIKDRTLALVRKLKNKRPTTSIVLVEDRPRWTYFFDEKVTENKSRRALRSAFNILKAEMNGIYYIEGDQLLANSEGTVDNSHPNDLGMYFYFEALKPIVKEIIDK